MTNVFNTIGIIGNPRCSNGMITHEILYYWLKKKGYHVIIEDKIACSLTLDQAITDNLANIGQKADLAIIIGGDGNMLRAARVLSSYDIKIIGINRGNLGFLTDLDPDSALTKLSNILLGHYRSEKRFLLEIRIYRNDNYYEVNRAINEIVFHSGKIAHMIEFEVYIDDVFAFSQRSDGLIISTSTGSTAYSLSAGGPILMPLLDAIVLVPMFPHTLSSRPLVIKGSSTIQLKFSKFISNLEVSCDSQNSLHIKEEEKIFICRSNYHLNLIHSNDYNYFNVLSTKLGWSNKLF